MDQFATLRINVEGQDLNDSELDRLTRQLRSEVRDGTDATKVDFVPPATLPAGAKGGESIQLGTLAVQILPAAIPGLISVLRSWAARQKRMPVKVAVKVENRSIELEYPVGTMTQEDLMKLIAVVSPESPKHRS